METGKVADGLGDDKPRTADEVLSEAKDILEAEEKARAAEKARAEAEAKEKEENPDADDTGMLN